MMLNGVIDAAVQGGTEKYREAFFTPKFSKSNPGTEGHVSALKRLIGQQVDQSLYVMCPFPHLFALRLRS
jgi:hypothetical protein